ncbi:hypothetical protein [Sphingomonas abietis]|uniref:Uncharacterized protein n=1 Tax=Sphingomonas abietis TaxID=3012344 RepID=A0ABY7NIG9_9SPHN|nr:hypothetical protein [Sphingomonas abietis]WBO21138.1 hypothetical protein PBT88_13130 [Sphingomonas abietis]
MLLLSLLLASGSANGPVVHATDVKSDATDPLTERFAEALRNAIPKAKHMKPWSGDDADDLYLAVLWPVSEDGKRFTYAVDLMKKTEDMTTPDRLTSLTGSCRTAQLEACAAGVVGKADAKAKDD